jgi:DNA-binding MarR family transcriptional regulator
MTTTHSLNRGFLLSQASNHWIQCQKEALTPLELTPAEYLLLSGILHLQETKRLISQSQLAELTKIDMATVSRHLRNLESAGHVQKKPHPHDMRACMVSLTSKGKEKITTATTVINDLDLLFFGKSFSNITSALKELVELFEVSQ